MGRIVVWVFFVAMAVFAKPAMVNAVEIQQNNGLSVAVLQFGDERFHYMTTMDGYVVVGDGSGNLVYVGDDGKPTAVIAKNADKRDENEKLFLKNLSPTKVLKKYKNEHKREFNKEYEKSLNSASFLKKETAVPLKYNVHEHSKYKKNLSDGDVYIPVLLVGTSDKVAGDSSLFFRFFNEKDFSEEGNIGSLRDYCIASSNGKFRPNFDIYPIELPDGFGSYSEETFLMKALDILVERADFKAKRDAYQEKIPFVYLYPGMETDALGYDAGYWAHVYSMQWMGGVYGKGYCPNKGKVCFDDYLFAAQMEDNSRNKKLNQIGIFAHEFSHVLGLADHYASVNGEVVPGPAPYDVMTQGMYNNNGRCPPLFSAFERESMGWLEIPEIEEGDSLYRLYDIESDGAYAISNPNGSDEFYIVEYRPPVKWDSYIGKSSDGSNGILVWYIDYDYDVFFNKAAVNKDVEHQRVAVVKTLLSERQFSGGWKNAGKISDDLNYFADFSFVNKNGIARVKGVYNFIKSDEDSFFCFNTNPSKKISECKEPEEEMVLKEKLKFSGELAKLSVKGNVLYVEALVLGEKKLDLFDVNGKFIKRTIFSELRASMDVSSWIRKGAFVATLSVAGKTIAKKTLRLK